jgi:molybdate transport system ATP-binding protein
VKAETEPGDLMLAGIPAHDIIIATNRPTGLSARNILPARIIQLRTVGSVGLVTAEIASSLPPLTVEVTGTTFGELALQPNSKVFLVIKATSCRLYEGERG